MWPLHRAWLWSLVTSSASLWRLHRCLSVGHKQAPEEGGVVPLTSTLVPLLPLCRLEQLNSVLASFQGTHSYHNFTNEVCMFSALAPPP